MGDPVAGDESRQLLFAGAFNLSFEFRVVCGVHHLFQLGREFGRRAKFVLCIRDGYTQMLIHSFLRERREADLFGWLKKGRESAVEGSLSCAEFYGLCKRRA